MMISALQAPAPPIPVQRVQTAVKPAVQVPTNAVPQAPQTAAGDRLAVQSQRGPIPALAPVFQKSADLPPIEVEKRGNYTWYRNEFGVQITEVNFDEGKYYMTLSSQGQSIMLRQHDDKRDTLNFSDMNFNIANPSQIPNVFFHIPHAANTPDSPHMSKISFDAQHNLRIDLSNGEHLLLDRKDGQTLLEGPFSVNFNPDQHGENFNVRYTGQDGHIQRFHSKGDHVDW